MCKLCNQTNCVDNTGYGCIYNSFKLSEGYINIDTWQLCPKCNGAGLVNCVVDSTNAIEQCNLCKGKMIINKITGYPPQ